LVTEKIGSTGTKSWQHRKQKLAAPEAKFGYIWKATLLLEVILWLTL
jgi:hypothetical protein